jgi:hypothetical protein
MHAAPKEVVVIRATIFTRSAARNPEFDAICSCRRIAGYG